MSRIGNRKLTILEGVNLNIEGNILKVKGPHGELELEIPNNVEVKIEDGVVETIKKNEAANALQGTINSTIRNMIEGVKNSYTKNLEIVGVGYRFILKDKVLVINAGYSKPVEMMIPEGIKVTSVSNTEISLTSADKIKIGEFAALIRKVRKPEPYKGKGIRYKDEVIRRKEAKKAA